jgi:hypothetical protein
MGKAPEALLFAILAAKCIFISGDGVRPNRLIVG